MKLLAIDLESNVAIDDEINSLQIAELNLADYEVASKAEPRARKALREGLTLWIDPAGDSATFTWETNNQLLEILPIDRS